MVEGAGIRDRITGEYDFVFDQGTEDHFNYEATRRVPGSVLWTGVNRRYRMNPLSDAVHERYNKVEGVLRQYGVEMATARGQMTNPSDLLIQTNLELAPRLNNPTAVQMMGSTRVTFETNPQFRVHNQALSRLRSEYIAKKGSHVLNPTAKEQALNAIVAKMNEHYMSMEEALQRWEGANKQKYDEFMVKQGYEDGWTVDNMVEFIRASATVDPRTR